MKTSFLLYALDKNGSLNYFYTMGNDNEAFIPYVDQEFHEDPIKRIISELGEDVTSKCIYLGEMNLHPYNEEVIDCLAIDISKMELDAFVKNWNLTKKPASTLIRNTNLMTQAVVFKFLTTQMNITAIEKDELEAQKVEEVPNTKETPETQSNNKDIPDGNLYVDGKKSKKL